MAPATLKPEFDLIDRGPDGFSGSHDSKGCRGIESVALATIGTETGRISP
jgi:hypothetical protein